MNASSLPWPQTNSYWNPPPVVGIVIGAVAAAAGIHLVQGMLYGITAHGAVEFSLAAAALLIVAIFAAGRPAFRAASIDPMEAVRHE